LDDFLALEMTSAEAKAMMRLAAFGFKCERPLRRIVVKNSKSRASENLAM